VRIEKALKIPRCDPPLAANIDRTQTAIFNPVSDGGLAHLEEFSHFLHGQKLPGQHHCGPLSCVDRIESYLSVAETALIQIKVLDGSL
jgi:hypothetical protein